MCLSISLALALKYTLMCSEHTQFYHAFVLEVDCSESGIPHQDWAPILRESAKISTLRRVSLVFFPNRLNDLLAFHLHYKDLLMQWSWATKILYCVRKQYLQEDRKVIALSDFDADGYVAFFPTCV